MPPHFLQAIARSGLCCLQMGSSGTQTLAMCRFYHSSACSQRAALLACRLVAETQGAPPGQEPADRPALVNFVAGCDGAVQRLQADFQPISSRIGQVGEALRVG